MSLVATASSDSSTAAAAPSPRRWPRRSLLFLLLFLVGAVASIAALAHLRRPLAFEVFPVDAAPPIPVERVRLRERSQYPVTFLLIHGYGANRRQLLHLAEVLAAAGAEVYVPDLPGRGDHAGPASPMPPEGPSPRLPTPRETQAAIAVVEFIKQHYGVRRERLVVVGHSLGGGVALEVGRRALPAAVVTLAGVERPVAPGGPQNLYLITARLEIPPLRAAADRMYERATSGRAGQPSLVARGEFPASHTSLPFHSSVQRAIVGWANRAVPGAQLEIPPRFNASLLALEFSALFFLSALFVPLAGLVGWFLGRETEPANHETRLSRWSALEVFGYALVAGAAAVSAMQLVAWLGWPHPASFLRLADGDYLAAVMLLGTLWLLPVARDVSSPQPWKSSLAGGTAALALAAYLIFAGGGFLTWQLFDLWPTTARWTKLLLLALLLLPYAYGEERLRRSFGGGRRGRGFAAFLAWRLGLLAAVLYGVLALASGEVMLLLMAVPLVLLSLLQYFFSAVFERAVGGAAPGAVLNALLMSWIIASIAPLR